MATSEDPLMTGMGAQRRLALYECCHRLRELSPRYPQTYGVAVLADVNKRRWCPLDSVLTLDRLRVVFEQTTTAAERRAAGNLLAARLAHEVLGRLLPLVLLEGRAWDAGLANLWVHFDSDNDIDWVAVVDPTVRVLPDDPWINGGRSPAEAVVMLPGESALTTWVAHRCHRTLAPLFVWLHAASGAAVSIASMWRLVGSAVVMAPSRIPHPPGSDQDRSMRRSQAVLDAMMGFGLPVRGPAIPARRLASASPRAVPAQRASAAHRHPQALARAVGDT